jgi:hypothetical protein
VRIDAEKNLHPVCTAPLNGARLYRVFYSIDEMNSWSSQQDAICTSSSNLALRRPILILSVDRKHDLKKNTGSPATLSLFQTVACTRLFVPLLRLLTCIKELNKVSIVRACVCVSTACCRIDTVKERGSIVGEEVYDKMPLSKM